MALSIMARASRIVVLLLLLLSGLDLDSVAVSSNDLYGFSDDSDYSREELEIGSGDGSSELPLEPQHEAIHTGQYRKVDVRCPPVYEGTSVTIRCLGSWSTHYRGRWYSWNYIPKMPDIESNNLTRNGQEISICDNTKPCLVPPKYLDVYTPYMQYDYVNRPNWFQASLKVESISTQSRNRADEYQCVVQDYDNMDTGKYTLGTCKLTIFYLPMSTPQCTFVESHEARAGRISTRVDIECRVKRVYPHMLCDLNQRWSHSSDSENRYLDVQFERRFDHYFDDGIEYRNETCTYSILLETPGRYELMVRIRPADDNGRLLGFEMGTTSMTECFSAPHRTEVLPRVPSVKIARKTMSPLPYPCPDEVMSVKLICYVIGFTDTKKLTYEWFVGNERLHEGNTFGASLETERQSSIALNYWYRPSNNEDASVTCRVGQGVHSRSDSIASVFYNYNAHSTSSRLSFVNESSHELGSRVHSISGTTVKVYCQSDFVESSYLSLHAMCIQQSEKLVQNKANVTTQLKGNRLEITLSTLALRNRIVCICWAKEKGLCYKDRAIIVMVSSPMMVSSTDINLHAQPTGVSRKTIVLIIIGVAVFLIVIGLVGVRCGLKSRGRTIFNADNGNHEPDVGHGNVSEEISAADDEDPVHLNDPSNIQPSGSYQQLVSREPAASAASFRAFSFQENSQAMIAGSVEETNMVLMSDSELDSTNETSSLLRRGNGEHSVGNRTFVRSFRRCTEVVITEEETRVNGRHPAASTVHDRNPPESSTSQTNLKLVNSIEKEHTEPKEVYGERQYSNESGSSPTTGKVSHRGLMEAPVSSDGSSICVNQTGQESHNSNPASLTSKDVPDGSIDRHGVTSVEQSSSTSWEPFSANVHSSAPSQSPHFTSNEHEPHDELMLNSEFQRTTEASQVPIGLSNTQSNAVFDRTVVDPSQFAEARSAGCIDGRRSRSVNTGDGPFGLLQGDEFDAVDAPVDQEAPPGSPASLDYSVSGEINVLPSINETDTPNPHQPIGHLSTDGDSPSDYNNNNNNSSAPASPRPLFSGDCTDNPGSSPRAQSPGEATCEFDIEASPERAKKKEGARTGTSGLGGSCTKLQLLTRSRCNE